MAQPAAASADQAPATIEPNYVVISADCHGGANIVDYRPYLEPRYHDDFDAWRTSFENPTPTSRVTTPNATGTRTAAWPNWRPTGWWPRSCSPTPFLHFFPRRR